MCDYCRPLTGIKHHFRCEHMMKVWDRYKVMELLYVKMHRKSLCHLLSHLLQKTFFSSEERLLRLLLKSSPKWVPYSASQHLTVLFWEWNYAGFKRSQFWSAHSSMLDCFRFLNCFCPLAIFSSGYVNRERLTICIYTLLFCQLSLYWILNLLIYLIWFFWV